MELKFKKPQTQRKLKPHALASKMGACLIEQHLLLMRECIEIDPFVLYFSEPRHA
jgi:hypothetical protein